MSAKHINKAHEAFKSAITTTVRALAGRGDVSVMFSTDRPFLSGNRIRLPDPPRTMTAAAASATRGHGDSLAARLAMHDETVHAKLQPTGMEARQFFDALEQARVEIAAAAILPGLKPNITAMLNERYAKLQDPAAVPLYEGAALFLRGMLAGMPIPENAKKFYEHQLPQIMHKLGGKIDVLQSALGDQAKFATLSRELLSLFDFTEAELMPEAGEELPPPDQAQGGDEPDCADEQHEADMTSPAASERQEISDQPLDSDDTGPLVPTDETTDGEIDDQQPEDSSALPPRRPQRSGTALDECQYKVFTSKFDEITNAEDLCEPDELERLRNALDKQIQDMQNVVSRLANKLQRRLLAQQQRAWDFDLEEGYLDPARLSRVIADPMLPLSYKWERDTGFRDTVVTLLIDNSGSMRGRPITIAAICADILARTLERCGVKVEILGFTTRAWKGGSAREAWVQAGKPTAPGRLNDLRHIIYKSADTPWRRARKNLGLMLREGLLKENIDGEALLWAHNRLIARPEQRRILMMISDGAPVDDSTLSANTGTYLEEHLRAAIATIEAESPVELLAIGIGHDVTRYYSRAVTLVDADALGGAMVEKFAELFDRDTVKKPSGRKAA